MTVTLRVTTTGSDLSLPSVGGSGRTLVKGRVFDYQAELGVILPPSSFILTSRPRLGRRASPQRALVREGAEKLYRKGRQSAKEKEKPYRKGR